MATQMTFDDVESMAPDFQTGMAHSVTDTPTEIPENVSVSDVTRSDTEYMITLMCSVTAERFNIYQNIKYDEFMWVLDHFDDDELADMFVSAMEAKEIPHIDTSAQFLTCEEFLSEVHNDPEYNEWTDDSFRSIGMVLSHISEDSVADIYARVKESDSIDSDISDTILSAALMYGLTDETINMDCDNITRDIGSIRKRNAITAKYEQSFDLWEEMFVDIWSQRATNIIKPFIEAGVNESGLIPSTNRRMYQAEAQHFGEIRLTDAFIDNLETLYTNTQEHYSRYDDDKEREMWRSVRSPDDAYRYRPSAAESWSEKRREAKRMNDNIIKTTVKIPGVLFTYESCDAWDEDGVLVKNEWCILGSHTGRVEVDYTTDGGKNRWR